MEKYAARKIEDCYCCYRDRQMFKLLKYAISTADHSLTYDIMRKISLPEAELLKDPVFQAITRFRFAGEEFPPYIVFKIFLKTDGHGIKYLSGKKAIRPDTEAAVDSCNLMGNRKYFDQMISDLCEENQSEIHDEFDVSNLKDYMKYISTLDERSARTGGKGNPWRTLTLEAVPRQHIIYDVLIYLHQGTKTDNFLQHLYSRKFLPPTQAQQVEYIKALSLKKLNRSKTLEPSRRSKQARERVEKMRKLYQSPDKAMDDVPKADTTYGKQYGAANKYDTHDMEDNCDRNNPLLSSDTLLHDIDFNDNSWEEEGKLLFEWTQNLSVENVATR